MTHHSHEDLVEKRWEAILRDSGVGDEQATLLVDLTFSGPELQLDTSTEAEVRARVTDRLDEIDYERYLDDDVDPESVRNRLLAELDRGLAGNLRGPLVTSASSVVMGAEQATGPSPEDSADSAPNDSVPPAGTDEPSTLGELTALGYTQKTPSASEDSAPDPAGSADEHTEVLRRSRVALLWVYTVAGLGVGATVYGTWLAANGATGGAAVAAIGLGLVSLGLAPRWLYQWLDK